MLDYQVTIGLAPMRRDVTPRPGIFNWEKAEKRGKELVTAIEEEYGRPEIRFVDLAGINKAGVMYSEQDADAVIERFRRERAEAVFLINCNFGNEEIAGRIAEELGKPVLLWAPLDEEFEPDGTRYTDSQCGIFGVSKQLQRLGIPFSYIKSCRIGEQAFRDGWDRFVRTACMVKNFKGMRIGQIGMRPKPFCSVIYNEGELMQKFGIRVIPINMAVVIDNYQKILKNREEELEKGEALLRERFEIDALTEPKLKQVYAFVLLFQELFEEYNLDAAASECWTAMQLGVGAMPCAAFGILADLGYVIACETDVHAAITMALLSCAALGKSRPFLGEFTVRNPEKENCELLWHCGPFAYSLKKKGTAAKLVNMRQWFQVKDGTYTAARLDQDGGNYGLLSGTCRSGEGPYTFGTYLWAEFGNLDAWENSLVEGPYIHHMSEVEGDYTAEMKEFCKYIKGIDADRIIEK